MELLTVTTFKNFVNKFKTNIKNALKSKAEISLSNGVYTIKNNENSSTSLEISVATTDEINSLFN